MQIKIAVPNKSLEGFDDYESPPLSHIGDVKKLSKAVKDFCEFEFGQNVEGLAQVLRFDPFSDLGCVKVRIYTPDNTWMMQFSFVTKNVSVAVWISLLNVFRLYSSSTVRGRVVLERRTTPLLGDFDTLFMLGLWYLSPSPNIPSNVVGDLLDTEGVIRIFKAGTKNDWTYLKSSDVKEQVVNALISISCAPVVFSSLVYDSPRLHIGEWVGNGFVAELFDLTDNYEGINDNTFVDSENNHEEDVLSDDGMSFLSNSAVIVAPKIIRNQYSVRLDRIDDPKYEWNESINNDASSTRAVSETAYRKWLGQSTVVSDFIKPGFSSYDPLQYYGDLRRNLNRSKKEIRLYLYFVIQKLVNDSYQYGLYNFYRRSDPYDRVVTIFKIEKLMPLKFSLVYGPKEVIELLPIKRVVSVLQNMGYQKTHLYPPLLFYRTDADSLCIFEKSTNDLVGLRPLSVGPMAAVQLMLFIEVYYRFNVVGTRKSGYRLELRQMNQLPFEVNYKIGWIIDLCLVASGLSDCVTTNGFMEQLCSMSKVKNKNNVVLGANNKKQ